MVPVPEDEVSALDAIDLEYAQQQKAQGWRPSMAFLPSCRVPMPLLPLAGTDEFYRRWQVRIPHPGTAFLALSGICDDVGAGPPENDIVLPVLGQVPAHGDPGHAGIFQCFGLAGEAARLHVRCFLFIHFYSGYIQTWG